MINGLIDIYRRSRSCFIFEGSEPEPPKIGRSATLDPLVLLVLTP